MTDSFKAAQTNDAETSQLKICKFQPQLRDDFVRLNKNWIERFFRLEECDVAILSNPEKYILEKGGEIFFARLNGTTVGCCALIFHEDKKTWELAKMAVDPEFQGHGIGLRLGLSLIDYARSQGVKKLFLEANTKLEASVKLYVKLGFKAV